MTARALAGLSDEVKKKLREIGIAAVLALLRFLIEKLASNPGGGEDGADR